MSINFKSTKISNIRLTDDILVAVDLSNYADGTFVNAAGDSNVGTLQLSGNIIITQDSTTTAYGRNSFVQAEANKYGKSSAGTMGWVIIGVDKVNHELKLSGDVTPLSSTEILDTMHFSIALGYDALTNVSTIDSVALHDGYGIVTLNVWNSRLDDYDNKDEEYFINLYTNDDNGFFAIADSELGHQALDCFYGCFALGGNVKAVGRYAHAEGRRTIAGHRYSHAEGDDTQALGMAAHSEGANGIRATGNYSHAEGYENVIASGMASHAEGTGTLASGQASHAEGAGTKALNGATHAEGLGTVASGLCSHAEGLKCVASGGAGSHAEGNFTTASGGASHSEGSNTIAAGANSHAAGFKATAVSDRTYVWNGKNLLGDNVSVNMAGTYNIYPENGLSGFYIDGHNFMDCLLIAILNMTAELRAALRLALNLQ